MSLPAITDPRWSDAQRQFVAALDAAGANKAEHAVPIDRATPLSARDLQSLLDSGVVREASANGYYIYPRQVQSTITQPALTPMLGLLTQNTELRRAPLTPRRLVKMMVFWILILLIPIILLQLTGKP